jgi:hypothetical protein
MIEKIARARKLQVRLVESSSKTNQEVTPLALASSLRQVDDFLASKKKKGKMRKTYAIF